MKRRFALCLLVLFCLDRSLVRGDSSACVGHGGAVRRDPASGAVVCHDGTLDKRNAGPDAVRRRPRKRVLKFKPRPDTGQILSPGEKPPSTTLKDSR